VGRIHSAPLFTGYSVQDVFTEWWKGRFRGESLIEHWLPNLDEDQAGILERHHEHDALRHQLRLGGRRLLGISSIRRINHTWLITMQ
jgi:hypothetical protein